MALLASAVLGACAADGGGPAADRADEVPEAPAYAEVAERYNQRANLLERLWARATITMRYQDERGRWETDQGDDGHLMLIRPDHLWLTTGKLGETYFHLGSNAERYWWFDLRDPRRAWVGTHDAAASRANGQPDGLPVRPLDLIELLGVMPLPPEATGQTGWSDDRTAIVITLPTPTGSRRLALDPATYEPRWVELLDPSGRVVLRSELSAYQPMPVAGSGIRPRVPGRILIHDPASEGFVRIALSTPQVREGRPPERDDRAFDFERLARAYGVSDANITDLDASAETAADPRARIGGRP